MTPSDPIDEAVAVAEARGHAVREITNGWAKAQAVVHMAAPLDHQLRTLIARDARLRYWRIAPTPHQPAESGFFDDEARVAIAFPEPHAALPPPAADRRVNGTIATARE